MPTILVIDDNSGVRTALDVLLSIHEFDVVTVAEPSAGLEVLASSAVDLVIQDMNFRLDTTSGEEGIELFHEIRGRHPDVPIILLTAWTHLETAVGLVKAGAADYLAKPWDDARLLTTVRNLLELRKVTLDRAHLVRSRARARAALADKADLCGIVYESDAMHQVIAVAVQVAASQVPVLITGPNGSGKEVLAHIVQANSAVRTGPFVKVNVGALPHDLMEAELFGSEVGAYTGATRARQGRFEAAHGGTLFLDEIGNLSLEGQAKLLRVLQTGEFERLGSSTSRRVEVRIVSATNSDLKAAIAAGRFREDLYYRLNVIELAVPPLAQRPDDIVPLARHCLRGRRQLGADAERLLLAYPWPGNVRELANVIERAALLASTDTITARDLRLEPVSQDAPHPGDERDIARSDIELALQRSEGVVARAARELGLSRQALYRRMEKLGVKL